MSSKFFSPESLEKVVYPKKDFDDVSLINDHIFNPEFVPFTLKRTLLSKYRVRQQRIDQDYILKKDRLAHLDIVNQIDNKFIIAKIVSNYCTGVERILLAIDQHALHERINLEHLENLYV